MRQLGAWKIDTERGLLISPAQLQRVEPRVMAVLMYLLDHEGQVVSKKELLEEIWGTTHVVDESLHRCVSILRKALGDDPHSPRYIETIPKRGYRLLAQPEPYPLYVLKVLSTKSMSLAAGSTFLLILLVNIYLGSNSATSQTTSSNSVSPRPDILEQANSAYYQYERVENENAIHLYQRAIEQDQNSVAALSGLANSLAQRYFHWGGTHDDLQIAMSYAHAAEMLNPESPLPYRTQGLILSYQDKMTSALEHYLVSAALEPGYWPTAANVANLYFIQGKYHESIEWFSKAAKLENANLVIINARLGDAYLHLGNIQLAEQSFRTALDIQVMNDRANAGLARIYLLQGKPEKSLSHCKTVIERSKQHNHCALVAGDAALELGLLNEAGYYFEVSNVRDTNFVVEFHLRTALLAHLLEANALKERSIENAQQIIAAKKADIAGNTSRQRAMLAALSGHNEQAMSFLNEHIERFAWSYLEDSANPVFTNTLNPGELDFLIERLESARNSEYPPG